MDHGGDDSGAGRPSSTDRGQVDAERLGELLRAAVETGAPNLLAGCGTSEHAARAGKVVLEDRFRGAVVTARDAFEATLNRLRRPGHRDFPTMGAPCRRSPPRGKRRSGALRLCCSRPVPRRRPRASSRSPHRYTTALGATRSPIVAPAVHRPGNWRHCGRGAQRLIEGLGAREQRRGNAEDLAGCS